MDARAKTIREILHTGDQFLIPFFQRYYSWKQREWDRLCLDLWALTEDGESTSQHFLGPLVCTPTISIPVLPDIKFRRVTGDSSPGTDAKFGRDLFAVVSDLTTERKRVGSKRQNVYCGISLRNHEVEVTNPMVLPMNQE